MYNCLVLYNAPWVEALSLRREGEREREREGEGERERERGGEREREGEGGRVKKCENRVTCHRSLLRPVSAVNAVSLMLRQGGGKD